MTDLQSHDFNLIGSAYVQVDGAGEDARSVGVGMSPGDAGTNEPYFYVSPWPYPRDPSPPELPHGAVWQREGWFGAVLTASALLAGPAEEQQQRAHEVIDRAVDASLAMLAR